MQYSSDARQQQSQGSATGSLQCAAELFSMSGVKSASDLGVSSLQQVYRDVAHGKLRHIIHWKGETGYPSIQRAPAYPQFEAISQVGPQGNETTQGLPDHRYFKTGIKLKGHQPIPASPPNYLM